MRSDIISSLLVYSCRITNAVKTSGVLKERLFNAAYNSKKQAVMNGMISLHIEAALFPFYNTIINKN